MKVDAPATMVFLASAAQWVLSGQWVFQAAMVSQASQDQRVNRASFQIMEFTDQEARKDQLESKDPLEFVGLRENLAITDDKGLLENPVAVELRVCLALTDRRAKLDTWTLT